MTDHQPESGDTVPRRPSDGQPAMERPVSVQPGYRTAAPAASSGLSVASLVIGVVSVFAGFSVILPLVGVVLGIKGLKREPGSRGLAIAGIWINAVILALVFVGLLIALVVLLAVGSIPFIADRSSGVGETIQAVLLFSSARGSV